MVKIFALLLVTTSLQAALAVAPAKKSSIKANAAAATATPTVAVAAPAPTPARKEVTLTQKMVAELVLQQGDKTKEVNLKYQQFRLAPVETLSKYDWKLNAATGYEFDNSTSILSAGTVWSDNEYKRYKTSVGFEKPFTTGTKLGLELSRISQKTQVSSNVTTPPPSEQTYDNIGITLEQSLLGNFFGVADRGAVNAAELTYKANEVNRANELEDVVLDAIRQFWNSYVSQENFKETVASRDRYKTLVDAIRRKTRLGYSTPGDLPQVQAEFEGREQLVKTTSTEYLKNIENLVTLLDLEPGTEIKFEVPTAIPTVPALSPKDPQTLRTIRSQKLKTDAANENLSAAESLSYPFLDFVGSYSSSGADQSSENSFSQLSSGSRPSYYMGLRLTYQFGSDLQNETIINRKLQKDLEETRLKRQLNETNDLEGQAERRAQAAYAVAVSAERQKGFRDQAVRDLNKSYNQGRTDISVLITAMNNFFNAEIVYLRAMGEYHIALNEWAAVRDELIADERATDVNVK